jgi:hypothetical protein
MAQFRGTLDGQRGQASRLGSKASGLTATCNGWGDGIEVRAWVNKEGQDVFEVWSTGGSNHTGAPVWLGTWKDGVWLAGSQKVEGK